MSITLGVIFAFIALLGWGFGDFFIQRTVRVIGSVKTVFCIGLVGVVGLFPFVKDNFFAAVPSDLLFLGVVGIFVVIATLVDFEALRLGKIAIIEPIIGFELPLTVMFAVLVGRESLTVEQLLLIIVVCVGIILSVITHHAPPHYRRKIFEKGILLAGIGAIGMALTNVFVGIASRDISPLMTIWSTHVSLVAVSGIYLLLSGKFSSLFMDIRHHARLITIQSVLDNTAWVAFAYATTAIPISIATTISESYIALAALLGILINCEQLRMYQIGGVALAIAGVIILSIFTV